MRQPETIALIGGGASGTLTAIRLLHAAHTAPDGVPAALVEPPHHATGHRVGGPRPSGPLSVLLIDDAGRHGRGVAYSTTDPGHLLNVPADRMSAFREDPGHFLRWAEGPGFFSRGRYGDYLTEALAAAERVSGITVRRVTASVAAVLPRGEGGLRLQLAGGGRMDVSAAVLAMGSPRRAPNPRFAFRSRYVADPWREEPYGDDGEPVLIVGTGLTMVDIALKVTDANPGTVVYAVSRHGLLPRRHAAATPAIGTPLIDLPPGRLTTRDLLRAVRHAVADHPGDWRDVVDALRPHTQRIWADLSEAERRRFLARAARYWEIHRHRMAPAVAQRVACLRASGRLRVLRGIERLEAVGDGFEAHVGGRTLTAGWLVDAIGPAGEITADPLVRRMVDAGLATPDPLLMGLRTDGCGALLDSHGRPQDNLFTLGPPRRGELYETTAIPEIRDQAAAIAPRILGAVTADARIRSA